MMALQSTLSSLCFFLVSDMLLDLLKLKAYGGDCIASCPEVLSGEISLSAVHPSNGNRAFAFQKADH
jgi:hypothetical protein